MCAAVVPSVQRAAHGDAASIENVRVDHRRLDAFVSQQLLHRANIIAVLQQVRGEAVPATRGVTLCEPVHIKAGHMEDLTDRAKGAISILSGSTDSHNMPKWHIMRIHLQLHNVRIGP